VRPSKKLLSRGSFRDHLPKSPTESTQPPFCSHSAQPTDVSSSPSATSSECTFATAPNSQSELQDSSEAHNQSETKGDETPLATAPSLDRQSYSDWGPLLPCYTQNLQDLWPGPMAGSFPSFDGSQQNPHETTSSIAQVRDLSSTDSHHSRGPIEFERLRSDACPKTNPEKGKPSRTSIRSQPVPPRWDQRSDTSWRKGHV
jgi:hypothetical protein